MEKDVRYCVYKHQNIFNGKVYIGITSQKPEYRWGSGGQHYVECPHFWNAIQKYGWDNFTHEILYDDLTAEEANNLEIQTVAEYDSTNPDFGYNISKGGFGTHSDTMKARWEEDAFREEMCEKMREAWKDPVKRAKRSERAKERWSNENFKEKVRESIKESCGTSVKCVETQQIYANICDVENELHLNHANICRAIRLGYKCGGYHWQKVDVVEKPND